MPVALLTPLAFDAHPGDAELVARARRGEDFAFDVLFRRHVQFVAAVALRVGRVSADVDDVVQETFVIAFRKLEQLAQPAAFRGWLTQIAVSRVRRRARFARLFRLFRDDADEQATLEAMASSEASPLVRAQLAQVDAVVKQLPQELRTAWTLRFVLGCTLEEVALGCGCSLATAKRRLGSAKTAVQNVVTVEIPE